MIFGFSSEKRLKSGWQFDLVFRTGRRETGGLVRLLFLVKRDGPAQIGVTVGKKMATAPQRTRGRRIMREAMRRLYPWIKDGVWVVASLRENALNAGADEVYADLAASLKRRGLLEPNWPGANWSVDRERD